MNIQNFMKPSLFQEDSVKLFTDENKRAMMALYPSPEYHSTQGEYDLIRGTFLGNYSEIRPYA